MYKRITEELLWEQKILLGQFRKRLERCPAGELYRKAGRRGRFQFYHKKPGEKPFYLNRKQRELVHELKYKALLEAEVEQLERNIAAMEMVVLQYGDYDYEAVNAQLDEKYHDFFLPERELALWETDFREVLPGGFTPSQNPFRREELIHSTSFGLLTRSKGEAMIAELLYMAGVPFHYEKELVLSDEYGQLHRRYPDLTIPLTAEDMLYWEHKGRFQDPKYRKRDERTMVLYHLNGIYEPKNLIVTMDGPDGAFHADAVLRIIRRLILPLM